MFAKKHKKDKVITLLYAGKDEAHMHVLMLQEYLEQAFTCINMIFDYEIFILYFDA